MPIGPPSTPWILIWAFCCGSAALGAPKWDAVTLNEQGLFYIDSRSITDESGHKVFWSAIDYKKPQTNAEGDTYLSVQSQLHVRCKAKLARVMHMTYFSGPMLTGKKISRQGMLHDWVPIDPSSPVQKIARRVC